ncbi:hypothetical protein BAE44_0015151 [Dichanthelium oligosanthes]|uniref:Uncharacterized protein n=1 Tax=Dichanthelium oligosanthes TaxID=888268 RepID=A0A1E5VFC5_9POAL|nr:hypothetical protein BAE44_0015151 [Dichanthelium oligosanthes]
MTLSGFASEPPTSPTTPPSMMSLSLGIPVKLLHEAAGHVVTRRAQDRRGLPRRHGRDGKVSQLEHVFIRESRVRFMIIPDMLTRPRLGVKAQLLGSAAAVRSPCVEWRR